MTSSTGLFTESNYKRYSLQPKADHDDDPPHAVLNRCEPNIARSSSFHSPSTSPTSRSRQSSPNHSPILGPSRLSSFHRSYASFSLKKWKLQLNPTQQNKGKLKVGKSWYRTKRVKGLLLLIGLLGSFFLINWIMLTRLLDEAVHPITELLRNSSADSVTVPVPGKWNKTRKGKKPQKGNYERLLALAAHALAENKREPKDLWQEPYAPASSWRPCADQRNWEPSEGNNGYILVTANGGINQQRVAVCNAVVVARLLNSTLVIPKFMFSSVWRDVSQFRDIYQEEHFIKYLTPDIRIVKELPEELQSLDLEAIGSVVSDVDMGKEAKPSFYLKHILPILLKNQVVHFVGFGNHLAFDPIPFELQRLRCRCNFHALRFVPIIQETGALLVKRLRQHTGHIGLLDQYLIGPFAESILEERGNRSKKASKYLSLHLRFEVDMVAHSLCEFGGGEGERKELAAYREIHFPALAHLEKTTKCAL